MKFAKAKNEAGSVIELLPHMANRHGLIAGATGTGKTVTLQTLSELFSLQGVPVFMADVKGDLSGLAAAGKPGEKLQKRFDLLGLGDYGFSASPVVFWDVYGEKGHPVRTTISEMGPQILARLMNLNETQASVLLILFRIADEAGLLLLDIKDLSAMIQLVQENLDKFKPQYGHLSPASLGTIQRALLTLESLGARDFFGEPAFNVLDLLQTDAQGRGMLNILTADKLLLSPVVYSSFLLWMLSELYETLPEVGDLPKPKLVFFFDEAHLLFKDTPDALVEKIEQLVRLVRSKGVGIYFVTQSPSDVPPTVLGQLAHRVQHALRAFTPIDKKAVKTAAETMRPNPDFDAAQVITELGVGEALVSVLDEKGVPSIVEQAWIYPPHSRMGAISDDERKQVMSQSPVAVSCRGLLRAGHRPRVGLRSPVAAQGGNCACFFVRTAGKEIRLFVGQQARARQYHDQRQLGQAGRKTGRRKRFVGHHFRQHRPARRAQAGPHRKSGHKRDAQHGLRLRARAYARPAGFPDRHRLAQAEIVAFARMHRPFLV